MCQFTRKGIQTPSQVPPDCHAMLAMTAFRHLLKETLQILLQKPSHHRKQMQACITPINTMIFVGIIERLELFVGFDKGIFQGY
jgi:hypothetical protein